MDELDPKVKAMLAGLGPEATATFSSILAPLLAKGVPVNVTSGYRDPAHNAAVGGAQGSQHIHRNAIDLGLKGLSEDQKKAVVSAFQSNPGIGGFGYYPKSDSIHVDVRPNRAAWGSDYHGTSVGQGWPDWLTQSTRTWLGQSPQTASTPATASGPRMATTPLQVPLVAQGAISFPPAPTPAQGQGKQPDPLVGLAKALGAFAGAAPQQAKLTPAPMMPDPLLFNPAPGATAPTAPPIFSDLLNDPDPLKKLLDPRGLFLGLA